jgi:hypothetical protein
MVARIRVWKFTYNILEVLSNQEKSVPAQANFDAFNIILNPEEYTSKQQGSSI